MHKEKGAEERRREVSRRYRASGKTQKTFCEESSQRPIDHRSRADRSGSIARSAVSLLQSILPEIYVLRFHRH